MKIFRTNMKMVQNVAYKILNEDLWVETNFKKGRTNNNEGQMEMD